MSDEPLTVLIVDDEPDIRLLVRVILQAAGYAVEVVGEARNALEALASFEALPHPEIPRVIILDNMMPGRSGIDVAEEILAIDPEQRIVLFTGYLNTELERQARRIGVRACVSKTDVDRLPDIVEAIGQRGDHSS